ncbi:hypothetical protein [Clostridium taeniosporum]|uniref:Uncharacterized protein n=1 Tax=Clostridium taeniosporum TaxID=394958 RepID=A0A1D7XLK0_9CLOT|nr:hypothetical protein [Clostridium taeniosporum]AOR24233.1 hypothetical protein BGI42_11040 [Clostridium taeniosporum]
MIEIKKEDLLKNTPDYEDYSENIYNLSLEELREIGILRCGGCCSKKKNSDKCKECTGCGKNKCSKNKL